MADFVAGSHSRIDTYRSCPKKLYHTAIAKGADKVPYVQSEQAVYGDTVHKLIDKRLKTKAPFPHGYERFEPYVAAVEQAPGQTFSEIRMTVDRSLAPCGYNDWDHAYLRMIVDVMKINGDFAWAGDWKTGKRNFDESQLKLSAAGVFAHFPDVNVVSTSYIWLDEPTRQMDTPVVYRREEVRSLWAPSLEWMDRIQESYRTNHWPAKPAKQGPPFCAWCSVNKAGKCPEAGAPPRKG